MNSLYHRLAIDGIRRHKRLYYPFVGTAVFFIVLINICISISGDPLMKNFFGSNTIITLMNLGSIILLIFALITLLTNYKFIQKNKAEESALYLTLGMEKKHLIKIYIYELVNLYLRSILIGTLISAVIYKLVFAGFIRLMNLKLNVLDSGVLPILEPLLLTALIFLGIFILLLVAQTIKMRNFTPMSFRYESKAGQKAPRNPIAIGIFGILCIGAGYYISLTTQNPMQALKTFFLAVILVIIGTYAAFTVIVSGILKVLQKKKSFYYKKENFTAVSGLIYRVRNSAKTLASIAILSTMVIIVLTSGFSLYFGISEVQDSLFPTDYSMSFPANDYDVSYFEKLIGDTLKENNKAGKIYAYKSNFLPVSRDGSKINHMDNDPNFALDEEVDGIHTFLDEKSTYDFGDYDAILFAKDDHTDITKIGDMDLKVKKEKRENYPITFAVADITMTNKDMLVFKDSDKFDKVKETLALDDNGGYEPTWHINFDVDGPYDPKLIEVLRDKLMDEFSDHWFGLNDDISSRKEFMAIYAGIFFVGIILGLGFIVSTVLAIYYKQLSEGIEDKNRFKTMRQLGMTDGEAKKSISKQMGLVFFLPLIFAFVHSLFAIPIITKFLELLSLSNTSLYMICLVSVFAFYIIFYFMTFKLTEKTYNNIVLD
ncbi:FtsX-like permease family protein [Anaerococcus provencensis]|uniref:FtsX-like permease family protein n=1 Tax=Anaerococcus provencensis TaxID=938293 RepID=UPI0002FA40CE|nr:FtsX-like permease family protein [Anaerococcus provencensis]